MGEPFVFHFQRGVLGNPEQMYLADIRAECGLCGHPQVQRYYHATPVHPVTEAVLDRLARTVRDKTDYECPNCGESVGRDDAVSTAFTWAFPDDRGLIRAFSTDAQSDELRWQFVPERRLDPQELPGWQPNDAQPSHPTLEPEAIRHTFERALSVKAWVRDALLDWAADPDGGAIVEVSADMVWLAEGPDDPIDSLRQDVSFATDDWLEVRLDESVPADLPTHREPSEIAGGLDFWLPDVVERARVTVLIAPSAIESRFERAMQVANLRFEHTETGYSSIVTPRDEEYPRAVPVDAIARRAVFTGLTPGDAARLTAEEIVGTLLRVW